MDCGSSSVNASVDNCAPALCKHNQLATRGLTACSTVNLSQVANPGSSKKNAADAENPSLRTGSDHPAARQQLESVHLASMAAAAVTRDADVGAAGQQSDASGQISAAAPVLRVQKPRLCAPKSSFNSSPCCAALLPEADSNTPCLQDSGAAVNAPWSTSGACTIEDPCLSWRAAGEHSSHTTLLHGHPQPESHKATDTAAAAASKPAKILFRS